jgi:hypothetical protein
MSAGFDLGALAADTSRGLRELASLVADGDVTISGTKNFDGTAAVAGAIGARLVR